MLEDIENAEGGGFDFNVSSSLTNGSSRIERTRYWSFNMTTIQKTVKRFPAKLFILKKIGKGAGRIKVHVIASHQWNTHHIDRCRWINLTRSRAHDQGPYGFLRSQRLRNRKLVLYRERSELSCWMSIRQAKQRKVNRRIMKKESKKANLL